MTKNIHYNVWMVLNKKDGIIPPLGEPNISQEKLKLHTSLNIYNAQSASLQFNALIQIKGMF